MENYIDVPKDAKCDHCGKPAICKLSNFQMRPIEARLGNNLVDDMEGITGFACWECIEERDKKMLEENARRANEFLKKHFGHKLPFKNQEEINKFMGYKTVED